MAKRGPNIIDIKSIDKGSLAKVDFAYAIYSLNIYSLNSRNSYIEYIGLVSSGKSCLAKMILQESPQVSLEPIKIKPY